MSTFDEFRSRVVVAADGEKRLSAADCCEALGYSEPRVAWNKLKHRNAELARYSTVTSLVTVDGKARPVDTLSLDGIVRLCMLARTPRAEQFRNWATHVLSQTIVAGTSFPVPKTFSEALRLAADEHERAEELARQNSILAPRAAAHDRLEGSAGLLGMAAAAQALGTGRQRLYDWCRAQRIIKPGTREPYQHAIDAGWFEMKVKRIPRSPDSEGNARPDQVKQVPLVTPKGLAYLDKRMNGEALPCN